MSDIPDLSLLGRLDIQQLGISVDQHLTDTCHVVFTNLKEDHELRKKCKNLCDQFPDLWTPELGCLKEVELEVQFKANAQPIFRKARPVPIALQDDLTAAIKDGIAKGIWEPTQFNDYGTPVVPVKKALLPGQKKAKIRVCGDYSCTVNPQLEPHRHPLAPSGGPHAQAGRRILFQQDRFS